MPKTDRSSRAKTRGPAIAPAASAPGPAALARLPNDELLEAVQRRTFRFFWDGADPTTSLAPDRLRTRDRKLEEPVTMGGSGFGVMALIVAIERGWISRDWC